MKAIITRWTPVRYSQIYSNKIGSLSLSKGSVVYGDSSCGFDSSSSKHHHTLRSERHFCIGDKLNKVNKFEVNNIVKHHSFIGARLLTTASTLKVEPETETVIEEKSETENNRAVKNNGKEKKKSLDGDVKSGWCDIKVKAPFNDWSLIEFLKHHLPSLSTRKQQILLKNRQVRVIQDFKMKRVQKASFRVVEGGMVQIPSAYESKVVDKPPKASKIRVLQPDKVSPAALMVYEDEEIAVINKPYGYAYKGSKKTQKTSILFPAMFEQPQNIRFFNRVDKNATGAQLLAKSPQIRQSISSDLIDVEYIAICLGVPKQQQGRFSIPTSLTWNEDKVERVQVRFNLMTLKAKAYTINNTYTYPCSFSYEIAHFWEDQLSVLKIKCKTNMKHAIRAYCEQALNVPVVGDEKYGGGVIPDGLKDMLSECPRVCLHARRVIIKDKNNNPSLDKVVEVSFPHHMKEILEQLHFRYENL